MSTKNTKPPSFVEINNDTYKPISVEQTYGLSVS